MLKFILFSLFMVGLICSFSPPSFSADRIPTKIVVRVVSKDAKVIGSGVGGALVRIKNLETGEILAQGKQEGGTGDTDRIMVQPRKRGATVYGTPGAALFQAEIPLNKPTRIEIYTEAPLAYPYAIQKCAKTLTLIPGKHILGEGVIIEMDGLIVNILEPAPAKELKGGKEVTVEAEVRML
ncbi:MAG: hypothetical protein A2156_09795 [Deltaproteobacteria bacterium RBG_16_48_10]|nr:MAG: hypothetical protein A2156_09795 [Deltaproteobacteria bacterium RBG_16_48_10]